MNLTFARLEDAQVEEAFAVLTKVGRRLEQSRLRQRISKTTFETYEGWQTENSNYVVCNYSQIVGLVTLRLEPLNDWPEFESLGHVPMLRALATDPDFQNNGIGAFAIRGALELVLQPQTANTASDLSHVYLDCVSDTLPSYYSRVGFETVARTKKTYPDGETFDITLMRTKFDR